MTEKEFLAEVKTHEIFNTKLLYSGEFWVIRTLDLKGEYYEIVLITSRKEIKGMTREQLAVELTGFLLQRCFS